MPSASRNPRPSTILWVLVPVAAAVLSGCSSAPGPLSPPAGPPPGDLLDRVAANVGNVTADGNAVLTWWEGWVASHPERVPTTPLNDNARQAIVDDLTAAGLHVEVKQYPVNAAAPSQPPVSVKAVVATKQGVGAADHVIALTSHYDTQAGTLYGAYDNGSGTAADLAVCKALAARPMNRTLVCLFFDGEEEGVLASRQFAKDVAGQSAVHYDFVLGFDMVGLNWPGYSNWKLYAWVGDEFAKPLFPFVNATLHRALAYPASGAEAFPFNDRNSDEASFKAIHVPTVRFAGGRTASVYPQYHMPQDTVDFVETFAGGKDKFAAGLGAIATTAVQLARELDQTNLDAIGNARIAS